LITEYKWALTRLKTRALRDSQAFKAGVAGVLLLAAEGAAGMPLDLGWAFLSPPPPNVPFRVPAEVRWHMNYSVGNNHFIEDQSEDFIDPLTGQHRISEVIRRSIATTPVLHAVATESAANLFGLSVARIPFRDLTGTTLYKVDSIRAELELVRAFQKQSEGDALDILLTGLSLGLSDGGSESGLLAASLQIEISALPFHPYTRGISVASPGTEFSHTTRIAGRLGEWTFITTDGNLPYSSMQTDFSWNVNFGDHTFSIVDAFRGIDIGETLYVTTYLKTEAQGLQGENGGSAFIFDPANGFGMQIRAAEINAMPEASTLVLLSSGLLLLPTAFGVRRSTSPDQCPPYAAR